jgi:hypothetical protein
VFRKSRNLISQHVQAPPQPKRELSIPRGPLVLRTLIENQDPMPKSTCDICDPEACRSIRNCKLHPHARVKLERSESLNRYGEKCHAPLKVGVVIAKCEVMHLAHRTIEYFDMPKEDLNGVQLNALAQLNEWLDSRIKDILSEQDNKDFDKLVPKQEMRQLWRWINEIFFGRDSSRFRFRWNGELTGEDANIAIAATGYISRTILMKTSREENTSHLESGTWMLDVLAVLIHEAMHIYSSKYGCIICSTTKSSLMPHGHGRAWQVLASRIEACFLRFTMLPVELGRWIAFLAWWESSDPFPSLHNLNE